MTNEREPGRTFEPTAIGWIDFECRSPVDIRSGTARYMTGADVVVCTWAIGDRAVRCRAVSDFDAPLKWADMPSEFHDHHARVVKGEAKWCAWNAGFDRSAWNYGTLDFPPALVEHFIDAMTQATNSGLPPGLKMAARFAKATAKVETGLALIKLFCAPDSIGAPESHPEEWKQFQEYAIGDVVAMREVFQFTRQLPLAEWREYWAMERVNERGVGVDRYMVKHATWLANEDKRRSAEELARLTEGKVTGVDQVAKLSEWLFLRLPPEGRLLLLKREEEVDEEGNVTRPAKMSLTRRQVERLIAYVAAECPERAEVARVLQIRLYGGSKTPAKFQRIWASHVEGVLYNQYVFGGAAQTGRASSKGVQVHNLSRDALPYEHEAIEAILAKCSYEELAALGDGSPVARKLSLLIRPAFVPDSSNLFVWSDWSNIEARITPWLADHHPGARERLQIFRDVDANPKIPDIYTRTAAEISGLPIEQIDKPLRQRGKVVELALGFLGGVGALHAMAAGYGMHFTDSEARVIVNRWREANPWATAFGDELWAAIQQAREAPGTFVPVNRVGYIFLENFLGGSMLCRLPSGRYLTYRALRWEMVDDEDDDGNVTGQSRKLTYGRGHGRMALWRGILVENCVQAIAADILRGTLLRFDDVGAPVRLHTHDEILVEVREQDAEYVSREMRRIMQQGFDWTDGLPIMSTETVRAYYTKHEEPK